MGLSRAQIVDAAYSTLCQHGLAGVSMRRLAQDLGVQPGALYHYVASKQDLLVIVAERIFSSSTEGISTTDAKQAACDIRETLLRVRDGAEVVSFVHVFKPNALTTLSELHRLFANQFPPQQARWAAQTLIHYVLGFVGEEQNHAELVSAKIFTEDLGPAESLEAFLFGVTAILRGLASSASLPRLHFK